MIDSDLDIMTTDSHVDTDTNIMTDDSTDIMTGNSQPSVRAIGKPSKQKDPNSLKIASFRTTEGVWAEFSAKAAADGLTATDVLKAAMEQYLSGEYDPRVITPISTSARHTNNVLTRNDVLEIVNTAISTERLDSHIMTAISTLSLCTYADVNTAISTAIDLHSQQIETSIEPIKVSIGELGDYTRSQLESVRKELKKPLAIAR